MLKEESNISLAQLKTIVNMQKLFSFCKSLTNLPDISKWNIMNVKDISGMFKGCISLIDLPDISNWNTINIINMKDLFNSEFDKDQINMDYQNF